MGTIKLGQWFFQHGPQAAAAAAACENSQEMPVLRRLPGDCDACGCLRNIGLEALLLKLVVTSGGENICWVFRSTIVNYYYFFKIFIYLPAPALSCNMWDLVL